MSNDPFQNFLHPGNIRRGLPAFAYTDESFHQVENERLFARAWVFAGFAHEMPRRGDVRPVEVGGKPVLLVRSDGGIAAFHNVCRHRCLKLVDRPGNAGRMIRCPYHSWVYDLDGGLRAAPYFGGADNRPPTGFNLADNGLKAIRCEAWHDWLFVNLDGGAMPFEDYIRPLADRLAHLDLASLRPVAALDFGAVNANWKFLMENFIEPYHVQFVHASTTDQPLINHAAFIDRHCLGCTVELPDNQPSGGGTLAVDSSFLTLFPNFVLATYAPDQLGVHINSANGAGQTRQRRVIYLLRDGDIPEREIAALKTLWRKVHEEDHAICERLQLGRQSPLANSGGWLSPKWEISVRRFQEMVYDAVSGRAD